MVPGAPVDPAEDVFERADSQDTVLRELAIFQELSAWERGRISVTFPTCEYHRVSRPGTSVLLPV